MKELIQNLKGDKAIWAFIAFLAIVSFMPVFSASSNLAYANHGNGSTIGFLMKHLAHIFMGFIIIYWFHKMPYHYHRAMSRPMLFFVWLLLIYTLAKGTTIAGANASRWIRLPIPFIKITFQTSTLAAIVLMVFTARYLAKERKEAITFKASIIDLWIPVFITVGLILPGNFSTAALIFSMVLMLVFIGKYPLKYIANIIGLAVCGLALFILIHHAFPDNKFFGRAETWENRTKNFFQDVPNEDDYQIEKAKIAIASGGTTGLGPGKSIQKNFLPQSSSDFIYAIIVEEYGLVGGLSILFIYLILFIRFIIAANKANTVFGRLLVIGLGFPMIFQAMINMAVAVELLPVTGQNLPLISSGGSSIWMTCMALGIIIAVTKKDVEIKAELDEAAKREATLKKMIDEQIERENRIPTPALPEGKGAEPSFSIDDKTNPMNAVKRK
jgi:cell division protein FtsW